VAGNRGCRTGCSFVQADGADGSSDAHHAHPLEGAPGLLVVFTRLRDARAWLWRSHPIPTRYLVLVPALSMSSCRRRGGEGIRGLTYAARQFAHELRADGRRTAGRRVGTAHWFARPRMCTFWGATTASVLPACSRRLMLFLARALCATCWRGAQAVGWCLVARRGFSAFYLLFYVCLARCRLFLLTSIWV
jgi:hypothetical protein